MVPKDDIRASDAARRLLRLSRYDGLWLFHHNRLSAVVHPRSDAAALARWWEANESVERLATCLRPAEVRPLDEAELSRWARTLQKLSAAGDLDALAETGAKPLRRYRSESIAHRLDRSRALLARARTIVSAAATDAEMALGWASLFAVTDRCPPRLPKRAALSLIAGEGVVQRVLNRPSGEAVDDSLSHAFGITPDAGVGLRLQQVVFHLFGEVALRAVVASLRSPHVGEDSSAQELATAVEEVQHVARVIDAGLLGEPKGRAAGELLAELRGVSIDRVDRMVRIIWRFLRAEAPVQLDGSVQRIIRRARQQRWTLMDLATKLPALVRVPESAADDSAEWRVAAAAALLGNPGVELPVRLAQADRLTQITDVLRCVPEVHRADCVARLSRVSSHLYRAAAQALDAAIPWPQVARALDLKVVYQLRLLPSAKPVSRYLDAVAALSGRGLSVSDDWFVSVFASGAQWTTQLSLAMLVHYRSPDMARAHLTQLAASLPTAPVGLTEALDDWSTPFAGELPGDVQALQALVGLDEAELRQYLKYRVLCGHGATLSSKLSKPLEAEEREAAQAAWLQARLAEGPDPELQRRLDGIQDPERRARAVAQRRKATARHFSRALERIRLDALTARLQPVMLNAIERLTGLRPPELTEELQHALLLMTSENLDHALFAEFLRDVLSGRSLADRAPNRSWLELQRFDTDVWLDGVDLTAVLNGVEVRIYTESRALRVLRMGSLFDTCLGLEEGENAASALTNALDANKHVIYVETQNGTIIGRKLIAVTPEQTVVGYNTYASQLKPQIKRRLTQAVSELADRCGLTLADEGTPAVLHDAAFWYDDGEESWLLPAEAHGAPVGDDAAIDEYCLVQSVATGQLGGLPQVGRYGEYSWDRAAVLTSLLHFPEHAETAALAQSTQIYRPSQAACDLLGVGSRLAAGPDAGSSYDHDVVEVLLGHPAPTTEAVRAQAARVLRYLEGPRSARLPFCDCEYGGHVQVPPWLVWLPVLEASDVIDRLLMCQIHPGITSDECDRARRTATEVLIGSILLWGPPKTLRVPQQQCVADAWVAVLANLRVQGARNWLRRRFDKEPTPQVGLALAEQGDPRDHRVLMEAFRSDPRSLRRALAVVRSGAREGETLVRDGLIVGPPPWRRRRLAQLAEVGPWHASSRARRQIHRHPGDGAEFGWALASVGLPGERGNPLVALDLAGVEVRSRTRQQLEAHWAASQRRADSLRNRSVELLEEPRPLTATWRRVALARFRDGSTSERTRWLKHGLKHGLRADVVAWMALALPPDEDLVDSLGSETWHFVLLQLMHRCAEASGAFLDTSDSMNYVDMSRPAPIAALLSRGPEWVDLLAPSLEEHGNQEGARVLDRVFELLLAEGAAEALADQVATHLPEGGEHVMVQIVRGGEWRSYRMQRWAIARLESLAPKRLPELISTHEDWEGARHRWLESELRAAKERAKATGAI